MSISKLVTRKIINYNSKESIAFKLREKRAERIKYLIADCYLKNQEVSIIDVGGTKTYWNIFPRDFLLKHNVRILLVNLPSAGFIPENDEIFTHHEGNGCNLSEFKSKSFHIAHSNSVIEHLYSWEDMVSFSNEIKRVAERYYVQTPNYWFPIEPHFLFPFFHWLPMKMRIKLISNYDLGDHKKSLNPEEAKEKLKGYNLLSPKELKRLFPHDRISKERVLLFAKSLIVVK